MLQNLAALCHHHHQMQAITNSCSAPESLEFVFCQNSLPPSKPFSLLFFHCISLLFSSSLLSAFLMCANYMWESGDHQIEERKENKSPMMHRKFSFCFFVSFWHPLLGFYRISAFSEPTVHWTKWQLFTSCGSCLLDWSRRGHSQPFRSIGRSLFIFLHGKGTKENQLSTEYFEHCENNCVWVVDQPGLSHPPMVL